MIFFFLKRQVYLSSPMFNRTFCRERPMCRVFRKELCNVSVVVEAFENAEEISMMKVQCAAR